MNRLVVLLVVSLGVARGQRNGGAVAQDITPIPMEFLNPRLTEFRRIDANNDQSLTFSEFLLSDRPFIESQSRYFHELDANGDGRVTREEFEAYFKKRDDESHRQRIQTDSFFKQLVSPSFFYW
ncbi:EF-hand domain and EF-hand domain pair-containing protein [Aphelenchoides fujianensis]|nr:EF-hand domain and EF-hand domain pair-containing protein [Aphelenchoides fujianensis]